MSSPSKLKWIPLGLAWLFGLGHAACQNGQDTPSDSEECPGSRDCSCVTSEECPEDLVCYDGKCSDDPRAGQSQGGSGTDGGPGEGGGAGDSGQGPVRFGDGTLGDKCKTALDCESGYCLAGQGGGRCSERCGEGFDECDEGYTCVAVGSPEFRVELCRKSCIKTEEVCNGRDDDCDGQIDEDFLTDGKYLSLENCGSCGNDCTEVIQHAESATCELVDDKPTCVPGPCLPGYYRPAGVPNCVPLPDNLCQSCAEDADCLVPSSRCLPVTEGKACARSCAADSEFGVDCPTGYTCQADGEEAHCVPISGSCVCTPENEGLTRSCPDDTCPGEQICEDSGSGYEFGECSAEGIIVEICDVTDNDCNEIVDDPFVDDAGRYVTDEHCGSCNNNCLVQWNPEVYHATGYCDTTPLVPTCVIDQCQSVTIDSVNYEYVDANQSDLDGCECLRVEGNTTLDEPDDVFLDPEGNRTYPDSGSTYSDENCDGIDGVLADAIFVRQGASSGNGTKALPFGTIQAALTLLQNTPSKKYILVTAGDYAERVPVFSGLRIYGGYSLDFSARNIVAFPSRLVPGESAFASDEEATVQASSITLVRTVVSGFEIHGPDRSVEPLSSSTHGANSIAVSVTDSSAMLEITNCKIIGGQGGPGSDGADGDAGFGRLDSGGTALNGGNGVAEGACLSDGACAAKTLAGGAAGNNTGCPAANGATGGGSICPVFAAASYTPADPSKDGAPGYNWTFDSASSGSCGSHVTESGFPANIQTRNGGDGKAGDDGSFGLQGNGCQDGVGSFISGVWSPASAANGATGVHGARGGVGASAGGVDQADAAEMPAGVGHSTLNPAQYRLGATGGGSGAGGCGGVGAGPGGSGGGSIAVLVRDTNSSISNGPWLSYNLISRGLGGDGADGGFGGEGGLGGLGGTGGTSTWWAPASAGKGGRGGRGGTGGGGGGGCGGISLGFALLGPSPSLDREYDSENQFLLGDGTLTGGAGGLAGPTGEENANSDGADGHSENYWVN